MSRALAFHARLVLSSLLFLPFSAPAQFTEVTLPLPSTAPTVGFSTALADALEISFNDPDAPENSFRTLDEGFGSYLAPRTPVSHRSRIYFNAEPIDGAPDGAAVKRGQLFPTPDSSALAFSSEASGGRPAVLLIRR